MTVCRAFPTCRSEIGAFLSRVREAPKSDCFSVQSPKTLRTACTSGIANLVPKYAFCVVMANDVVFFVIDAMLID